MENTIKLKLECSDCRGTGIYSGFAEPKGTGVICLSCGGNGYIERKFNLFRERKRRADIEIVRLSKGKFILDCGPVGSEITYEEFLSGKFPKITN